MKKIITIVGARPQFVKAAIVSRSLRQQQNINEILVHTGQHYDTNMSQIFFEELGIQKIDYQLGINSGTHGKQTGEMISAIENVLMQEKPDWLLIYGDTNSTLAGALAAAKLHIPIAHVEAGLRSYNRRMPEEINRIVADQLSHILFAPTAQSVSNLKAEGYAESRIKKVGDVMFDAALFYGDKATNTSNIFDALPYKNGDYILATIHRAENTDDLIRLLTIFTALEHVSKEVPVIMPLHPRTRKFIEKIDSSLLLNTKIHLIEPVGFLDMIMLEKHAALIITDSGGVQKEAFFYNVPCVTLRDETEWVETVQLNWNRVVKPVDAIHIYEQVMKSLGTQGIDKQFPYGTGDASHHISQYLSQEN
jgi:UDP-GlcNAc3NAcA epimerase